MSERRQVTFLYGMAVIFILAIVMFIVSINRQQSSLGRQQAATQATIEANSARRDAQMIALLQTMNDMISSNRAIGCVLKLDPDHRGDQFSDPCWTNQGLTPP